MKTLLLLVASMLVASNWVFADGAPNLDDPKVREKILREAVELKSLEERGPDRKKVFYQPGKQTPYTGWAKRVHDNGQVAELALLKDGKPEGPYATWHKNGQKELEATYKDGKPEGPYTWWLKNGRKAAKGTYKDGEKVKE